MPVGQRKNLVFCISPDMLPPRKSQHSINVTTYYCDRYGPFIDII
jgi:hypothetical protein